MQDAVDALLQDIAMKHGIALSRDDPILILHTINERLLHASAVAQQAQLDRHRHELDALTLQWSQDAKRIAERILNVSLDASKQTTTQVMQEGAKETVALMRTALTEEIARMTILASRIQWCSWFNVVTVCLTMISAGIIVSASWC